MQIYGRNSTPCNHRHLLNQAKKSPAHTLTSLKLNLWKLRLIEDLSHGLGTYFTKSKVITLLFCRKFSLLLKRGDFTGVFFLFFFPPWYFFRINLDRALTRRLDFSTGPEDYQFESPDKLWKWGQGRGEAFLYVKKALLKSSLGQGTWPPSSSLCSVCSVFGLNSFLERKCESAARSIQSENLLSVNSS